ncbi:unnamed protein product [Effrenium voratum]|uniref:Uncharacterized protein n=1 Tax=Effrenium voratum TaxID=2562239 RepID=A0AA36IA75_9DINO|nr:unnamed protein product [Effrenium voratum]
MVKERILLEQLKLPTDRKEEAKAKEEPHPWTRQRGKPLVVNLKTPVSKAEEESADAPDNATNSQDANVKLDISKPTSNGWRSPAVAAPEAASAPVAALPALGNHAATAAQGSQAPAVLAVLPAARATTPASAPVAALAAPDYASTLAAAAQASTAPAFQAAPPDYASALAAATQASAAPVAAFTATAPDYASQAGTVPVAGLSAFDYASALSATAQASTSHLSAPATARGRASANASVAHAAKQLAAAHAAAQAAHAVAAASLASPASALEANALLGQISQSMQMQSQISAMYQLLQQQAAVGEVSPHQAAAPVATFPAALPAAPAKAPVQLAASAPPGPAAEPAAAPVSGPQVVPAKHFSSIRPPPAPSSQQPVQQAPFSKASSVISQIPSKAKANYMAFAPSKSSPCVPKAYW